MHVCQRGRQVFVYEPHSVIVTQDIARLGSQQKAHWASLLSTHLCKFRSWRIIMMAAVCCNAGAAAGGASGSSSNGPGMSEGQRQKQLREYRVRLLHVVKASYGGLQYH